MYKKHILLLFALYLTATIYSQDRLLTGTPIGSSPSVDYSQGNYPPTTTINTPQDAFDGYLQTFYASYERSYTWVGLDLGTPHIITRVGWSPRNDGVGAQRMILGLFQGANQPDFSDAIPLYIIDQQGVIGQITTADIQCSKGFRYVRYVGPNNARCNVAELQFYGHAGIGDNSQLSRVTNLPCVSIQTENLQEPLDKVTDIQCFVTLIGTGNTVSTDSAIIRCRGNASLQFPKKPYRIKFNQKRHVFDSPAKAKKWTLINNYGDKTLIRNMIAFEYSRRLGMAYTPYCQAVDVILNGEYKGCYQLCDQLDINKNRVNIDEMKPEDISGDALTGGYFVEMDGYAYDEPQSIVFNTARWNMLFTIKSPDEKDIQPVQKNYIQSCFNRVENAVYNQGDWRKYLDEDSFIKHFLIGELTGNTDTYWSCRFYKHRGNDTIFTGPEWDFDIAFDNDYRHYPTCNKNDYVYVYAGTNADFVNRIIKRDQQTQNRMQYLWSNARINKGFTAENINALVDSLAAYLYDSQRLNFMRWDILNQNVHMNPRNAGSYEGEILFLKNYITQRFTWMDTHIGLDYNVVDGIATPVLNFDGHIKVYNIQGMLIYEGNNMPTLTPGFYIVQKGEQIQKIIIR